MAECEDRGLIRHAIADQLDTGKAAHGGHLDQGLFHGWIAQRIALLLQVDAKQLLRRSLRLRGQRVGRPAAFLARLRVVRLDQVDECLPGHHSLHLGQKLLALGALLGRAQLIVRESSCLPPINPVLACNRNAFFAKTCWVFQSFLNHWPFDGRWFL